jgi:hypothetical protein
MEGGHDGRKKGRLHAPCGYSGRSEHGCPRLLGSALANESKPPVEVRLGVADVSIRHISYWTAASDRSLASPTPWRFVFSTSSQTLTHILRRPHLAEPLVAVCL